MRSGSSERSALVDALSGPSAVAWQAALVAGLVFVAGCVRNPPDWDAHPWRTFAAVGEGLTSAEGPSVAAVVDALQREPVVPAASGGGATTPTASSSPPSPSALTAGALRQQRRRFADRDDESRRSGRQGGAAVGSAELGANAGAQGRLPRHKSGVAPLSKPASQNTGAAVRRRKPGASQQPRRSDLGKPSRFVETAAADGEPSKALRRGDGGSPEPTGLASWWNPTRITSTTHDAAAADDAADSDLDVARGRESDPVRGGRKPKKKAQRGTTGKTQTGGSSSNSEPARRHGNRVGAPGTTAASTGGASSQQRQRQEEQLRHQQKHQRNVNENRPSRKSGGVAHSSIDDDRQVGASSSSSSHRASVADGRDRSNTAGSSADRRRRRRAGPAAASIKSSSASASPPPSDPPREAGRRAAPPSSAPPEKAAANAPLFDFWPLSVFEALVGEALAGLDSIADMAADLTTAWLIAIGVLSLLLGCAVLYALRQVTVLRESVDQLAIDLVQSRSDLDKSVKEASKKAMEASAATAAAASPNTHAQAAEAAELLIRMRTVEKELTGQQERLTEFIHRAASERAAPSRRSDPAIDPDASFANMVSPSGSPAAAHRRRSFANGTGSPTGDESGLDAASPGPSVAADDSVALQAARMLAESAVAQRNARPVRHTNRGLSFSLPPKLWVYERMSSDPRDCVMKKRLHAIMLGHSADVNVPGEVCFLFATTETSRQQGMADLLSEAARNRTGAPGVTCIPASAILAMDIRPAPRELVDSMGPVAGDGRNLLISVYRATSGVALVDGSSSGAGPGGRKSGGWNASEPGERSGMLGSSGAGDGFTRRQFLSRTSGASGGASVSDKPFVVFMPSSLALDEWVNFVVLLLGDKVKVAEGATAEAHFTDL